MAKKQKIWLGIFLAMFLVPEILWNPMVNFYYELFQSGDVHPLRNNFLTNADNFSILKFIMLAQFIGLAVSSFFIAKSRIRAIVKMLLSFLIILSILLAGFAVLFIFYNNPQIG